MSEPLHVCYQYPGELGAHPRALQAALNRQDADLAAILDALDPGELYALANAADRLRRACEHTHNGGQGEVPHHGRTRWEFQA